MDEPSLSLRAARKRVALAEATDAMFNNGLTKSNLEIQRWALGIATESERHDGKGETVSDVYALKQPGPDGSEWIQEHDSLEDAVRYQGHSGGVLVKRQPLPGQPGLWWVEVSERGPIGKGANQ